MYCVCCVFLYEGGDTGSGRLGVNNVGGERFRIRKCGRWEMGDNVGGRRLGYKMWEILYEGVKYRRLDSEV